MYTCFLLLGSNQGDRHLLLHSALREITLSAGDITKNSSIYQTEPWGFSSQKTFLNMVVEIKTMLSPEELLTKLLVIEAGLGRVRNGSPAYNSRTLDIDILFFENLVLKQPQLTLPHPRLHLRRFALVPMLEIAPDFIHPVFGKTISELHDACDDKLTVELVS
jgi:2-amino-4-hydroxy-6-hydroxymethyldihydropteridine diphosphokinase